MESSDLNLKFSPGISWNVLDTKSIRGSNPKTWLKATRGGEKLTLALEES